MTKPTTTFTGNINPFTGEPLPTKEKVETPDTPKAAMVFSTNEAALYHFLELLALHQKWVDGGSVGQQPFAISPTKLTQSIGCSMNAAAKDQLMRERVTWNKRGEIRIKTSCGGNVC